MRTPLTTLLGALLLCSTLSAQTAGQLDSSFAGTGILQWDLAGGMDTGHGVLVQQDGRIVVSLSSRVGTTPWQITVARLLENGGIDSSFAENGVYRYPNVAATNLNYGVSEAPDGSLFTYGAHGVTAANTEMVVIKLSADGQPDPSFGTDGAVIIPGESSEDYAKDVAFLPDGKVLVAGWSKVPGKSIGRMALCRLMPDGTLDTAYGTNGILLFGAETVNHESWAMALLPDGKALVAGRSVPSGKDRPTVYRVMADGSGIDSTFAGTGAILAPFDSPAYDMLLHPVTGHILLCGGNTTANGRDLFVAAYDADGYEALEFGTDGVTIVDRDLNDIALGMALQPDGSIIAAGESGGTLFAGNKRAYFAVRLDMMGQLDTTWGDSGAVRTQVSPNFAFANDVAVQPHDGKVLLVGAGAYTNNDLVIVRYGNFIDQDGDGYPLGEDCNDTVFAINPGAVEIPDNQVDEDCDGEDGMMSFIGEVDDLGYRIHPNPAADQFFLIPEGEGQALTAASILGVDGTPLRSWSFDRPGSTLTPLSLEGLPSGMLILLLETPSKRSFRKLIHH